MLSSHQPEEGYLHNDSHFSFKISQQINEQMLGWKWDEVSDLEVAVFNPMGYFLFLLLFLPKRKQGIR